MKLKPDRVAMKSSMNRVEACAGTQVSVPATRVGSGAHDVRVADVHWFGDCSEAAQISRKFSAFAGSGANARALVTGLRMGHAIVLETPGADQHGSMTFIPLGAKLRHGNIYLVFAIAERSLAGMGITSPTPTQIETVLNGGFVTVMQDGITHYIYAPGILKMRSRGNGWRGIAHATGLNPDHGTGVRRLRDDAASNEVIHEVGAQHSVGSVAPAFASLIFALSLSLGVQSKARANFDVVREPATPSKLFRKLDTDHDGYVSRAEAKKLKDFADAFDDADANHDGRLSPEEFIKAEAMYERTKAAEYIDDSLITAKVKAGLLKDPEVSALDVGVETYKGRVLLSGFVDSREQIRKAKRIASAVRGVQAVQENLLVK